MRYQFLKEHRGELGPIKKACAILKVSKSGYYEYLNRSKSQAQMTQDVVERLVAEVFISQQGHYGYRRINQELRQRGIVVSEKRVLKAMQKLGLQTKGAAKNHRKAKVVKKGNPHMNLVDRVFNVKSSNRLWVGGIIHIPTHEGWLYLAVVIDVWSRKVIAWSLSDKITEELAVDALNQAVIKQNPPNDFSLVFHANQSVQYTSRAFQNCLESHGIAQSLQRPGNDWDIVVAESFFVTLKNELVKNRSYLTKEEVKQEVYEYIELKGSTRTLPSQLELKASGGTERDIA